MKRSISTRLLVGLVILGLAVFFIGGILSQSVRADNGPIPLLGPGKGPALESNWTPTDPDRGPDGVLLSEPAQVTEVVSDQTHPSGIIGLNPNEALPIRSSDRYDAQPQGWLSPGDGLIPEGFDEVPSTSEDMTAVEPTGNEINVTIPHSGRGFLQTTISETIVNKISLIDAPMLNNDPSKLFIASTVLDPIGSSTIYHNHPLGAFYSDSYARWSVFNEDQLSMVSGPTFNIYYPDSSAVKFTHIAAGVNLDGDFTLIDNAALNGNPNAYAFILPVYNPGGVQAGPGWYNHQVGVYYDGVKWWIFNEDAEYISENSAFFVFVANPSVDVVFKHWSNSENVIGNYTVIDHPSVNGNPNAVVLVQHIGTTYYVDESLGLWYSPSLKRWTIYNNSGNPMTTGEAFNVLIIPQKTDTFVYKATADRVLPDMNDHVLRIDHPLLDYNPNAQVYAIHNWNPFGDANHIIDPHPIGVIYSNGHWNIYHTDFEPIHVGSTFNVYITTTQLNSYSTEVQSYNTTGSTFNLNHAVLNNHPTSIFLEMQNFSPGEDLMGYTYGYESSVSYSSGRWSAKRAAGPDYVPDTAFNVLIPSTNKFIHIATPDSYPQYVTAETCINNPQLNNRPGATVFVTANDTPNGVAAPIDNNVLGVYYHIELSKWCIYNETSAAIPNYASFNVFIGDAKVFLPLIKR